MKRKVHEKEVRKKIIKTARQLFLEQGFHQTTIRQITQKSGISTGTLYHFYQDKEDIFFHIADETFLKVIEKSEEMVPEHRIFLRLVCEVAVHIQAFTSGKNMAELYAIAYGSYSISEEVMRKQHARIASLLELQGRQTGADVEFISLTVKGFLHALALKSMNGEDLDPQVIIPQAARLMLTLFKVDEQKQVEIIERLEALPIYVNVM
ncbi:MAG: TetR/AcrR family transcriptional regulator [Saprospiraceae bacterium]|nr:TetR/AcrR family transcriptional regulator [Saprospiraceae bacterium]